MKCFEQEGGLGGFGNDHTFNAPAQIVKSAQCHGIRNADYSTYIKHITHIYLFHLECLWYSRQPTQPTLFSTFQASVYNEMTRKVNKSYCLFLQEKLGQPSHCWQWKAKKFQSTENRRTFLCKHKHTHAVLSWSTWNCSHGDSRSSPDIVTTLPGTKWKFTETRHDVINVGLHTESWISITLYYYYLSYSAGIEQNHLNNLSYYIMCS